MFRFIFALLLSLTGLNAFAAQNIYEISCRYYNKSATGDLVGGEFNKTFAYNGSSDSIQFGKVLDFNSADGLYHFSTIQGDEGTQFLAVQHVPSKKSAHTWINFNYDISEPAMMSVILASQDFDAGSGFYGGDAGILCEVERL